MHLLQSIVTLAILTSTVVSAPARPQREGRSFKVHRVKRDNYVPNGLVALRKAYRKFGFHSSNPVISGSSLPQINAESTSASVQEGDVTASPQQGDVEFLSPVTVGGQTLVMDFDTGSSDL
jgi:aspergillopepsin I